MNSIYTSKIYCHHCFSRLRYNACTEFLFDKVVKVWATRFVKVRMIFMIEIFSAWYVPTDSSIVPVDWGCVGTISVGPFLEDFVNGCWRLFVFVSFWYSYEVYFFGSFGQKICEFNQLICDVNWSFVWKFAAVKQVVTANKQYNFTVLIDRGNKFIYVFDGWEEIGYSGFQIRYDFPMNLWSKRTSFSKTWKDDIACHIQSMGVKEISELWCRGKILYAQLKWIWVAAAGNPS